MKLSLSEALLYPVKTRQNRWELLIMVGLGLLPFGETFFLASYAHAVNSRITIEKNPDHFIPLEDILARTLTALGATFISFLYFLPGLVGIAMGIKNYFQGQPIGPWIIFLIIYGFIVISALPLAVVHAIVKGNPVVALHLPKLFIISLKVNLITSLKIFIAALLLFCFQLGIALMTLFGLGFLMTPFKAYSQYVFSYALAISYVEGMGRKE